MAGEEGLWLDDMAGAMMDFGAHVSEAAGEKNPAPIKREHMRKALRKHMGIRMAPPPFDGASSGRTPTAKDGLRAAGSPGTALFDDEEDSDPDEAGALGLLTADEYRRLGLVADLLHHVYGDDAHAALDQAEFYSPDQPRDDRGRWSPVGEEGLHKAREMVREHLREKNPAPERVRALADHLLTLTVKQLHTLKREHGLKASAPNKAALVEKLRARVEAAKHGPWPGEPEPKKLPGAEKPEPVEKPPESRRRSRAEKRPKAK